ncbi:MAG: low molecular weight phosphotyrosine protein phosphatase [Myxococcales bacterium]|nr:low molecular weight phosphotyrosine protein phosphatase [Myxococcales bacterium]
MIRICFVCLGNICRSATAEGQMLALLRAEGLSEAIAIESAGTGGWHVGERADARTRETARARGYELESISRQFQAEDLERFEYVLAMDRSNLRDLQRMASGEAGIATLALFRDFDPHSPKGSEVPDPYYGGEDGFERVFDIVEAGCRGLLAHLRRTHGI